MTHHMHTPSGEYVQCPLFVVAGARVAGPTHARNPLSDWNKCRTQTAVAIIAATFVGMVKVVKVTRAVDLATTGEQQTLQWQNVARNNNIDKNQPIGLARDASHSILNDKFCAPLKLWLSSVAGTHFGRERTVCSVIKANDAHSTVAALFGA